MNYDTKEKMLSILDGVTYERLNDVRVAILVDNTFYQSVSIGALGRKLHHLLLELSSITGVPWTAFGHYQRGAIRVVLDHPPEKVFGKGIVRDGERISIDVQNTHNRVKCANIVRGWFRVEEYDLIPTLHKYTVKHAGRTYTLEKRLFDTEQFMRGDNNNLFTYKVTPEPATNVLDAFGDMFSSLFRGFRTPGLKREKTTIVRLDVGYNDEGSELVRLRPSRTTL